MKPVIFVTSCLICLFLPLFSCFSFKNSLLYALAYNANSQRLNNDENSDLLNVPLT